MDLSLTFLEIFMDRGYWMWQVIVMLVLAGAHVHITVKRCSLFPFTCGQVLKNNDKRVLIDENGVRKLDKKLIPIQKKTVLLLWLLHAEMVMVELCWD